MNGRNTFKLWFYIRTNRPDSKGRVPIYLRLTVSGIESTISVNRRINPKMWDSVRGIAKLRTNEADELNPYIETLREKATEAHRELVRDGKPAAPEGIISIILRRREREFTLVKLMERHNQQMEAGLGIISTYGNYKNFKTSLSYIQQFIDHEFHQKDLLLSELDVSCINKYVLYLQTEKLCHHNEAMKQVMRLNKLLNVANSHDWIVKLDHIILANDQFYSLADDGTL